MKVLHQDPTPNPDAMKFVLERQVLSAGSRSWRVGETSDMPLANALLAIEGVVSLFFVSNVVTLTKDPYVDWETVGAQAMQAIEAAEASDVPEVSPRPAVSAISSPKADDPDESAYQADPDFFNKPESLQFEYVNDVLDRFVRPGLAADGGGLVLVELLGRVARIAYEGACGSCPSAASGTLSFIEYVFRSRIHPDLIAELV
jgi:Fe-S cluster biogenesis protein NfuA